LANERILQEERGFEEEFFEFFEGEWTQDNIEIIQKFEDRSNHEVNEMIVNW